MKSRRMIIRAGLQKNQSITQVSRLRPLGNKGRIDMDVATGVSRPFCLVKQSANSGTSRSPAWDKHIQWCDDVEITLGSNNCNVIWLSYTLFSVSKPSNPTRCVHSATAPHLWTSKAHHWGAAGRCVGQWTTGLCYITPDGSLAPLLICNMFTHSARIRPFDLAPLLASVKQQELAQPRCLHTDLLQLWWKSETPLINL